MSEARIASGVKLTNGRSTHTTLAPQAMDAILRASSLSSQLDIHMANILLLLVVAGLQMGTSGLFTPLHFTHCTINRMRRISIGNSCIGSCAAQSTDDFVRMTSEWGRQRIKPKLPRREIFCELVIGKAEDLVRSRTGAQLAELSIKTQLAVAIGDHLRCRMQPPYPDGC